MPSRRSIATAVVALVLIGGAAAVWWQPARQDQQRVGRNLRGDDGPVPVIAALTRRADVPVYLDGVGTVRALNTVTVRPQVDGKLISVNYTEGQQVERGFVLAKIDPVTYQAAYDQAVAKKAQDEATLANARLDLARYTRLMTTNAVAQQQLDAQKATGGAARSAGAARSGADRQRQGDPRLHQHRRADRRPHRHPPGRPGQHRARVGFDRHRRHHPASADLAPVHPAAAAARRGQPRVRRKDRCRSMRSARTTRR